MAARTRSHGAEPPFERYVAAPREPTVPPRLASLQSWLWVAIAILLALSTFVAGLLSQRQDPSLQVPGGGVPTAAPAGDAPEAPAVPEGGS